jgi:hypothetical protein
MMDVRGQPERKQIKGVARKNEEYETFAAPPKDKRDSRENGAQKFEQRMVNSNPPGKAWKMDFNFDDDNGGMFQFYFLIILRSRQSKKRKRRSKSC